MASSAISGMLIRLTGALALTLVCSQVLAEARGAPKMTVAVMEFGLKSDFQAHYGVSSIDGNLAAMMTSALNATDRFLVVERTALTDVLAEQELTAAGLVRTENAAEPGKLLGARLLLVGHVTEFSHAQSGNGLSLGLANLGSDDLGVGLAPNSTSAIVGIDVRVIDSTTGQVVQTFHVREKAKKRSLGLRVSGSEVELGTSSFENTVLGKAARRAVARVAKEAAEVAATVPWSGLVVDVEHEEVVINAGSHAGIEVGDRYRISRVGKILRDPATGRVLGERTRAIADVEVVEVVEEMSFARLLSGSADIPRTGDKVTL